MLRRIGNLTIANKGINVAAYYNHTPYRTTGIGFNLLGRWHFGCGRSDAGPAYCKAFAIGPIVFFRVALED